MDQAILICWAVDRHEDARCRRKRAGYGKARDPDGSSEARREWRARVRAPEKRFNSFGVANAVRPITGVTYVGLVNQFVAREGTLSALMITTLSPQSTCGVWTV